MASLSTSPNGRRTIQFSARGKRATLRLGKVDRKTAEAVRTHVERIIVARELGQPAPDETARWLAGIGSQLHRRIAATGIIDPRTPAAIPASETVGPFTQSYIDGRTDLKEWTRKNLRTCRKWLVSFFFADRTLASITKGHANEWHRHLKSKLSTAAASGMVKKARQIFADAVDRELIARNPFVGIKAGSQANEARAYYVPAADIERVIAACPNAEWRLVFALARYAGLRTPSETQLLKWADIDWARNRIRVTSPKTAHLPGKGQRTMPILAELLPHLREAFEGAADGAEYLLPTLRAENLRRMAEKIVTRAGLVRWPRLFQNLRASLETDLTMHVPLHVACAWVGNTQLVARKHYLQVTQEHYDIVSPIRAAESGASEVAESLTISEKPNTAGPGLSGIPVNKCFNLPPVGTFLATLPLEKQQIAHRAVQSALHGPGARRYFCFRGRMLLRTARQSYPGPRQRTAGRQVVRLLNAASDERGRA